MANKMDQVTKENWEALRTKIADALVEEAKSAGINDKNVQALLIKGIKRQVQENYNTAAAKQDAISKQVKPSLSDLASKAERKTKEDLAQEVKELMFNLAIQDPSKQKAIWNIAGHLTAKSDKDVLQEAIAQLEVMQEDLQG